MNTFNLHIFVVYADWSVLKALGFISCDVQFLVFSHLVDLGENINEAYLSLKFSPNISCLVDE